MSHNNFLQALTEERSNDEIVIKKYAGIRKTLTDLYPDKAHFIYELMQNAEDASASEITFNLDSGKLIIEHNGSRLFNEKDVRSITDIGDSSKSNDNTSIGKFGVGFKAVFSYTNTPIVYSDDFSFRIRDLIVPEQVEQINDKKGKTIFEFPFNNPKKPAALAVSEIDKGLCALGDNTLLFLSHIRKISYSLPDGSQGSLERIDHENGRIEIRAKHPHSEETVSHWLHFHNDVVVTDSESNRKKCRVAIAYQLEKVTEKNKNSENWKIIPIQGGGQVSIYFPAEKETSKLRFHIHAPFASTVARDSVRDCDDNKQLRDHLADLITESLSVIRDQKMLVMSFLAVLPNVKDELAEFYEPIREKIVHEFQDSNLTPTKNGDYFCARFLYRSSSTISNLISNTDLKLLINDESSDWVANAPQQDQRENNFLDSLDIKTWSFEQLSEIFASANREKTESWIETKDDDWLRRFYNLLKDAKQHHEKNNYKQPWEGKNFPLVRVNSEKGVKHVLGNEAYFESSHGHIVSDEIKIVKFNVYTKNTAKQDIDENAKAFLESIGVRPFDEKAAIELRLGFYKSTPPKNITDQYYDDIKRFIGYWKANRTDVIYSQRKVEELFKPVKFLLGMNNGSIYWRTAAEICLDSPIMETGLSELVEIHEKFLISSRYSKNLTIDELKDFVEFLKAIGVMYQLEITRLDRSDSLRNPNNPYDPYHPYYKWTANARFEDYSIENLDNYLKANNVLASRLVWNIIINSDNKRVQIAGFQPNRNHSYKEVDSRLIHTLKNYDWIPTKSGEFCNPKAMTRYDLLDDFPFNNSNGLLTAIEFGKNSEIRDAEERKRKEQQKDSFKQKERFAKELGAESVDEAEEAIKLLNEIKNQGKTIEEIRAIYNPKKPDFSDDSSTNPNRRYEKLKEDAINSPKKLKEMRQRSVSDGEYEKVKQRAKEYLKDRYTINDVLYCQICKKEMPFKLSDGSYYFEAVSLINDTEKSYIYNFIALCPVDAAKFKFANLSRNNMKTLIKEIILNRTPEEINNNENGKNYIELVLADNSEVIEFTPKHLGDIKSTLDD